MDLQARVGLRLAELREERGLSQHQLAKATGLSSQYVSRLESGARAPSFKALDKLAATLKVDPSELLRLDPAALAKMSAAETPAALAQLLGAARRLASEDLEVVLAVVRRLARAR